jgi:hypothetical protein
MLLFSQTFQCLLFENCIVDASILMIRRFRRLSARAVYCADVETIEIVCSHQIFRECNSISFECSLVFAIFNFVSSNNTIIYSIYFFDRFLVLFFLKNVFVYVFKSIRWMPWHREPKKGVVACDKPRGVGKRALIRGCPNGGTHP